MDVKIEEDAEEACDPTNQLRHHAHVGGDVGRLDDSGGHHDRHRVVQNRLAEHQHMQHGVGVQRLEDSEGRHGVHCGDKGTKGEALNEVQPKDNNSVKAN